jgi:hypothetical protein
MGRQIFSVREAQVSALLPPYRPRRNAELADAKAALNQAGK